MNQRKILPVDEVARVVVKATGLSPVAAHQLMAEPFNFPRPIEIRIQRPLGWYADELQAWLDERRCSHG